MAQFRNNILSKGHVFLTDFPCAFSNSRVKQYFKRCFYFTPKYLNSVCWKCGKDGPEIFFCGNCHIIQKPSEEINYFTLFGIQEKFNVDQTQLRRKFREFQSLIHPDKFSTRSNLEKNISEEYSSLLNKAYGNLQIPLKRAEYLLKLKGEEISEAATIDEPTFLMKMMNLNEEVEEARNNPDQLKILNEENKKALEKLIKALDEYFTKNDWISVKQAIVKMKYFASLGERINNYLREMGVTD